MRSNANYSSKRGSVFILRVSALSHEACFYPVPLREERVHDLAVDVCQAEIAALKTVGKAFVIKA